MGRWSHRQYAEMIGAGVIIGLLAPAVPAGAADLTLTRVMLSSGGVGYFEYEATVDGDAKLNLDVPLDQVDDVLKSLVVYAGGGTAGEITLPGREPLAQGLADMPFDRSALDSTADLLNALQGAELTVKGPRPMSGRIVRAVPETTTEKDGATTTRHRVTLLSDAGLEQFTLEDVDSVAFSDPALQAQLNTALSRIAAHRGNGKRELTIETRGTGKHTVRIGYVVGMPLWKASYRLSLPADASTAKARLQGWAVLENFSGQPWKDVTLTLLSGDPVTFRQSLYESYYVQRPIVPVEVNGRVLPSADSGSLGGAQVRTRALRFGAAAKATGAMAAAAPAAPPPPPEPMAGIDAAVASENASQVSYTLPHKVSVAAGQSLVVPVIDGDFPARRVDLYQPASEAHHPLAAIDLTNAAPTGLPPGVLTLYAETAGQGTVYLGDARLANFPPGDQRLLSYAVDTKIAVDHTSAERRYVVSATIAGGAMHLTRLQRQTTTYQVKAAAGGAMPLIVEQPRQADWILTAPDPKTVTITANAYRIPLDLAGKTEGSLTVTEDRPIDETIELADLADDRLAVLVSSNELDPAVRKLLGDIATRRQAITQSRSDLDHQKAQRQQLVDDEKRLRENIASLGPDSAYRRRTIDKLSDTDKAIDDLSSQITKATSDIAAAQAKLQTYVAGLTLQPK